MGTLSITKTYADTEVLLESDLDNIKDDVEAFINGAHIADANITAQGVGTASLADSAVTTAKINAAAVTTAKIADLGVTQGKIALLAVDTAQMAVGAAVANIATGGIVAAKIGSDAVTTVKILDSNVTTAKIAALAVTQAKLATCPAATNSTQDAAGITTSASLACTITGTSRPVLVTVTACDYWQSTRTVRLYKNTSSLIPIIIGDNATTLDLVSWSYVDTTGYTGSLTYDLRTDAGTAGPRSGATLILTVVEL